MELLRGLGPVQDSPMDLSVRETSVRHRRKNSSTRRVEYESSESSSDIDPADDVGQNDENFNKKKIPLDLTKTLKVAS